MQCIAACNKISKQAAFIVKKDSTCTFSVSRKEVCLVLNGKIIVLKMFGFMHSLKYAYCKNGSEKWSNFWEKQSRICLWMSLDLRFRYAIQCQLYIFNPYPGFQIHFESKTKIKSLIEIELKKYKYYMKSPNLKKNKNKNTNVALATNWNKTSWSTKNIN